VKLHHLRPAPGAHKKARRVGRGHGSGRGKTSGRGTKGSGARTTVPVWFEGGQMPLQRRLPKRGFRPIARREYAIVNLEQLAAFAAGSTVGPDELRSRKLVRGDRPVKCLGDGTLAHALTVRLHAFSKTARERIAAAGGTVETIGV